MGRDQDVARRRFQKGKALLEIFQCVRMVPAVRELESLGRNGRKTVGKHNGIAQLALTRCPGPTRTAGSVPGSRMFHNCDRADTNRFSIFEIMHIGDRRDALYRSILWIAAPDATVSHDGCAPMAGEHAGTAPLLELGNSTCVIEMNVRIENDFHILDAEAQRPDIFRNLPCGFGQAAIDQNVPRI